MEKDEHGSIRILLINEQVLLRAALRQLIESWPGLKVVGEADSASEALKIVKQAQPDILIFDHDFINDGNGLDLLSDLSAGAAEGRIILLTRTPDPETRLRAIRRGATGVVLKHREAEELRKAIHKVYQGEIWLDRSLTADVIAELTQHRTKGKQNPEIERINALSQREREVALLACQGLPNGEIAKKLFISEVTVRHHFTSIFSKLGVANRFELVIFLYRHKFVAAPA